MSYKKAGDFRHKNRSSTLVRMMHSKSCGYTIVEVLIFFAVTGLMFAMISVTFIGQQGRTLFSTAARDIDSIMQDISNDVSTGFYPSSNNITCTTSSSGPSISSGAVSQGTNEACIFLGRIVHFNVSGDPSRYDIYTVVGLREDSSGEIVANYNDAKPGTHELLRQEKTLPGGVEIDKISSGSFELDGVGFFASLNQAGPASESGALYVSTVAISHPGQNIDSSTMLDHINNQINDAYVVNNSSLPAPVTVCLNSTTSNQHAVLSLGMGRRLTTDTEIFSGNC